MQELQLSAGGWELGPGTMAVSADPRLARGLYVHIIWPNIGRRSGNWRGDKGKACSVHRTFPRSPTPPSQARGFVIRTNAPSHLPLSLASPFPRRLF